MSVRSPVCLCVQLSGLNVCDWVYVLCAVCAHVHVFVCVAYGCMSVCLTICVCVWYVCVLVCVCVLCASIRVSVCSPASSCVHLCVVGCGSVGVCVLLLVCVLLCECPCCVVVCGVVVGVCGVQSICMCVCSLTRPSGWLLMVCVCVPLCL